MKKNIILIGMPSSGKTTVGKILSKKLSMNFLDTDIMYKYKYEETPKQTVKQNGREEFLKKQEKAIKTIKVERTVISTGGAVIYNCEALENLKRTGFVFYLDTPYDTIVKRVNTKRELTKTKGQDLFDLYKQRNPIYNKFANFKVDCKDKNPNEIADIIIKIYEKRGDLK